MISYPTGKKIRYPYKGMEHVAKQDKERSSPRAKFNNSKQEIDGYQFDSKIEARYYQQLKLMKADFKVHEKFEIQPAFNLPDGHHVRRCIYTPDFSRYENGRLISVIDTKGKRATQTDASSLRMKFFMAKYKVPVIIAVYDYKTHEFHEKEK